MILTRRERIPRSLGITHFARWSEFTGSFHDDTVATILGSLVQHLDEGKEQNLDP